MEATDLGDSAGYGLLEQCFCVQTQITYVTYLQEILESSDLGSGSLLSHHDRS